MALARLKFPAPSIMGANKVQDLFGEVVLAKVDGAPFLLLCPSHDHHAREARRHGALLQIGRVNRVGGSAVVVDPALVRML